MNVELRSRLGRYSVEEARVDQLLEEELDVAELRVLDPEGLEHAQVPVFHGHEHGAKVLQVGAHQVQRGAEVLYRLRLCLPIFKFSLFKSSEKLLGEEGHERAEF